LYLYYADTYFQLSVSAEDYSEDNNTLFKQLYLKFNFSTKTWLIESKKIEEVLLWFEKYNIQYILQDSAKEKLEEIRNSYKREVEIYRNREFNSSILNENIVPYNYQLDVINWMLQRSACLNTLEPGLGKTFCAISVFAQLYKQKEIDGIIILVPIGLSFHWLRQIIEFTNAFKEEDIQIINNEEKFQCFNKFKDKKILIIRHDLLSDVIASYKKDYNKLRSLKNIRWSTSDFVDIKKEWNKENIYCLVDECHSFNHLSAIKTKALFSIKKYFKYRFLLTATPSINGFEYIYPLIKFVDNSIIRYDENSFKIWISKSIGNKWDKYAITSYNSENVAKVMKDYRHVFIQLRKEDLEEVKTKKFIKQIECDLTYLQKQIYKKIVERELKFLYEEHDTISWKLLLSKIHLILEVFDNPELLKQKQYDDIELNSLLKKWNLKDDPKIIYLKNRVEEICDNQDKKLIIYDIHPFTIDMLEGLLSKYFPLKIHGALKVKDKEKDRQEKQDLFNFDKKHKILLLSLYTSSAGINLQYGANNIIINTLSWDATLFRQSQDRIDRINSKEDSHIELPYYPLSLDNLRMQRNFSRVELNSKMDKELSQEELNRLLKGIL
jgi:hypothetical protein